MNRTQATTELENGKYLRHSTFTDGEFIAMLERAIVKQNGNNFALEFFGMPHFADGWEVYELDGVYAKVFNWFYDKKGVKLEFEQAKGIVDAFQDGTQHRFYSELKVAVCMWTAIDLKVYEIKELEDIID